VSRIFFPQIRRRESYPERKYRGIVGNYVYTAYRRETREDCNRSCYYCDRHEDEIGGEEEFELDHFRPCSFPEYRTLENDPRNLVWSCHKCNNLKLGKWPARGSAVSHASGRGFIDRFATDDAIDYFSVKDDGEIVALKPPAQYIIDELKLDRDGLRKQRMVRIHTTQRIREVIEWLEEIRVALMNPSLPTEEVQNLSDLRARFVRFLDGWRVDYDYLFRRIRF
jgi:hypothetical protein